jgi:hypothetical protein
MIRARVTRMFALGVMAVTLHACGGPRSESKDLATAATQLLEPDLHFALAMPGYEPQQFKHDSDLFANWGELLMVYRGAAAPNRTRVAAQLLRAAQGSGWTRDATADDNIELLSSLASYGLTDQKEELVLGRRHGSEHPPGSHCRIWLSPNADRMLIAYRFDSN